MTLLDSILLGILQGLTEFLPVSSSGHLEIGSYLLGIHEESNLLYSLALHGGTVLSTIVVFRKELARLIKGFFRFQLNEETHFVLKLLLSAVPILIVGLLFGDFVESLFVGNLTVVGSMLLLTAVLLYLSGKKASSPSYRSQKFTYWRALVIGCAQAVAVLPGLSRSGTTISTGLLVGVKRDEVARFSFLMVLIPIIGANLLELLDGEIAPIASDEVLVILAGFLSSFLVGVVACRWMIRLVSQGHLKWFALYCLLLGLSALILSSIQ